MRPLLPLLLASCAGAASVDRQPFWLSGGLDFRAADTRDLTGSHGWYAGTGLTTNESAFIGLPGLDVEWRGSQTRGSRLHSFDTMYTERVPLTREGDVYVGAGLGTFFHLARIKQADDSLAEDEKFTIGGKAIAGAATGRFFAEGGYMLSGKVAGVDTSGFFIAIGAWF